MNLLDYPLLADENIHPEVDDYLHQKGYKIVSISEWGSIKVKREIRLNNRLRQR